MPLSGGTLLERLVYLCQWKSAFSFSSLYGVLVSPDLAATLSLVLKAAYNLSTCLS